jgi:hypothetical protein
MCIIFIIILAGAIISFFTLKSEETQAVQKSLKSPVKPPQVSRQSDEKADSDISADIRRARQMLEKEDAGFQIQEKKKKGKWEVKDFNVLFAIRHADGKIKIVSIDPKAGESQQGYVVQWSRLNGVNTDFSVVYPAGCVVLAIKRVVRTDDEFGEAIYTPYSSQIDCDDLRNAGLAYLKKTIQMARADLRKVKSQAYPERSVSQTVSMDLALVLAIIEHIDPDRLTRGEPIEKLINEVLVVIGANQGLAYRYSISKANARGLFQFMPGTYSKIREQYQDAGLKEDFVQGMNNHLNAAKASLLLFDSDLRYLNQRVNLKRDKMSQGRYLASAYNCGAKRTAREIKSHKGFWEQKVPSETRFYLKKFSAVWNSLIGA